MHAASRVAGAQARFGTRDVAARPARGFAMMFNIERDLGAMVYAYLVPDSLAAPAMLRLRSEGRDLGTIEANEIREVLVAAGRHPTGQCGFRIDEAMIPGLSRMTDLELREAETDILVYRRYPADAIGLRLFRLETHLLPLWRLDDVFETEFHMWYKGIDRFGRETSTQILCLDLYPSLYASGRLLYKAYEYYLAKGFKTIAILRDPHEELAERILILKHIGPHAEKLLGLRDALLFEPVIACLEELESFAEADLKRFFRQLPGEAIGALANPLVRQLTSSTPDQMPGHTSLAAALDTLSSFEILGLRSDGRDFLQALSELCGIDVETMPAVDEFPLVRELGRRLRTISSTESFLEQDLELFHHTAKAFEVVAS
jgi:hypothetical protein